MGSVNSKREAEWKRAEHRHVETHVMQVPPLHQLARCKVPPTGRCPSASVGRRHRDWSRDQLRWKGAAVWTAMFELQDCQSARVFHSATALYLPGSYIVVQVLSVLSEHATYPEPCQSASQQPVPCVTRTLHGLVLVMRLDQQPTGHPFFSFQCSGFSDVAGLGLYASISKLLQARSLNLILVVSIQLALCFSLIICLVQNDLLSSLSCS